MNNDQDSETSGQAPGPSLPTDSLAIAEAGEASAVEAGWDEPEAAAVASPGAIEASPMATQAVAEPTQAVAEPTQAVAEPTQAVAEPTQAAAEPTQAPAAPPVARVEATAPAAAAAIVEAPAAAPTPPVNRTRRIIDMRRPRAAPPPEPARPPPPSFDRRPRREEADRPRREERPAPAVVSPRQSIERPSSPRQVDSPPAPRVAPAPRPAPIERPAPKVVAVVAVPVEPPPPAKAPEWIPPMGVDRHRKKKPALTAKEAMTAKSKAHAARKPAKPAPAPREIDEQAGDEASVVAAPRAVATTPVTPRPAAAKTAPKRSAAKRSAPKPPPPEDDDVPELPIKRGFFSRLLDVFRGAPKPKGD